MTELGILTQPPDDNVSEDQWVGESKFWAAKNVPMLSLAGTNPYFHTEPDVTTSVTSPALLDRFMQSISKATVFLV